MRRTSWPPKVEQALRCSVQRLSEDYTYATTYLYRNVARGDWLEDSDMDLGAVSDDFNGQQMDRSARVRLLAPMRVPVQMLAFTPVEPSQLLDTRLYWQEIASYWVLLNESNIEGVKSS